MFPAASGYSRCNIHAPQYVFWVSVEPSTSGEQRERQTGWRTHHVPEQKTWQTPPSELPPSHVLLEPPQTAWHCGSIARLDGAVPLPKHSSGRWHRSIGLRPVRRRPTPCAARRVPPRAGRTRARWRCASAFVLELCYLRYHQCCNILRSVEFTVRHMYVLCAPVGSYSYSTVLERSPTR